jgi:hypothetical protein
VNNLKNVDPDNELLNDELKIRKKRPLWGLFAAD